MWPKCETDLRGFFNLGSWKYEQDLGGGWTSDMPVSNVKPYNPLMKPLGKVYSPKISHWNRQSPDLRVAAFASMSLAPPKPERQSSADCGSPSPRWPQFLKLTLPISPWLNFRHCISTLPRGGVYWVYIPDNQKISWGCSTDIPRSQRIYNPIHSNMRHGMVSPSAYM